MLHTGWDCLGGYGNKSADGRFVMVWMFTLTRSCDGATGGFGNIQHLFPHACDCEQQQLRKKLITVSKPNSLPARSFEQQFDMWGTLPGTYPLAHRTTLLTAKPAPASPEL